MTRRPSSGLWIALVFLTTIAILLECILIAACVPPSPGKASVLSNFHLLELVSGRRSVRFGYIAFCAPGNVSGKITQICNSINSPINPSPQAIASKLPNVNPQLFNIAFFYNRTVFPILPGITLAFLVLTAGLLIGHLLKREKNARQAQVIMKGIFGCLGIALMVAFASAVTLTLTTSAIANMTTLSRVGYVATRGELAFRFHWAVFGTTALIMAACTIILPEKASGKDDYGSGYTGYGGYHGAYNGHY